MATRHKIRSANSAVLMGFSWPLEVGLVKPVINKRRTVHLNLADANGFALRVLFGRVNLILDRLSSPYVLHTYLYRACSSRCEPVVSIGVMIEPGVRLDAWRQGHWAYMFVSYRHSLASSIRTLSYLPHSVRRELTTVWRR